MIDIPRCTLCPRLIYRRPISPSGPRPCRICLIGEAPHVDEDKQGEPFCGKTGLELNNTYLPILGFPRSEIFVTNACMCSQPTYDNPTKEQAYACSSVHLGPLLAEVKPEVVVPMGAVACSLFGEVNLMMDHGIPVEGRWGAWRGVCWPTFHPTAGIHSSGYMVPLMQDFHNLKKFMGSCEIGEYRGRIK
jgi:uracil-DNA glycosylase family 4